MPRYKVTSTCNAVVRTTYFIEAASRKAALAKFERDGGEADEEEVYGHQNEELEAELVESKPPKSKLPSKKKGRN